MTIVEQLIAFRRQQSLSLDDVADRLRISRAAVSRFELQKHSPTLGTIERYAHAIGAEITFTVRSAP